MATVVLIGTLDTKGAEYEYFRTCLQRAGSDVILIDLGTAGPPTVDHDISRDEVANAAGTSMAEIRSVGDRAHALDVMAVGAASILGRLLQEGRLDGVAGLGGTGGSTLISAAMRSLPVGVPKLLVSTVAAGDTRPYVGGVDITLMYSVVDIAGINRISARIIANAAGAIHGMAEVPEPEGIPEKPVVGATMFGLTTPCVTVAREYLEEQGYEVLVFHATGAGGQALEALVDAGMVDAMLDATTTELADNLVGGVFSAGPSRLTAAARAGIPQVVSVGAVDMVNFGGRGTVPPKFDDRLFHRHNDTVTLMRTTPEESASIGREIAEKVSRSSGPAAIFFPRGGVSGIDVPGKPFHDPAADDALLLAIEEGLDESVELHILDGDINAPEFGLEMAKRLDAMYTSQRASAGQIG